MEYTGARSADGSDALCLFLAPHSRIPFGQIFLTILGLYPRPCLSCAPGGFFSHLCHQVEYFQGEYFVCQPNRTSPTAVSSFRAAYNAIALLALVWCYYL